MRRQGRFKVGWGGGYEDGYSTQRQRHLDVEVETETETEAETETEEEAEARAEAEAGAGAEEEAETAVIAAGRIYRPTERRASDELLRAEGRRGFGNSAITIGASANSGQPGPG